MSQKNEVDTTHKPRLDKWLWAARFFKTRALAVEAIEKHHVLLNGAPAKPGRDVKPGDRLQVLQGPYRRELVVRALSSVRGPATQAALLYEETPESVARREAQALQRRIAPEPALSLEQGRPTKRDRRRISEWDQRWSASADD